MGGRGGPLSPLAAQRVRRTLLAAAAVVFLAVFVAPSLIGLATDWLWFKEIGFQSVFLTSFWWRLTLFAVGGGFTFAFVYGNVRYAGRGATIAPVIFRDQGDTPRIHVSKFLPRLIFWASVIVALITGLAASDSWMMFVTALRGVTVGITDPLFGRDIGFYLFRLDAIAGVLDTAATLGVLTLIVSSVLYVIRGTLAIAAGRRIMAQPVAARHLGALIAGVMVVIAIRLWFVGASELLQSTTGPLVGASYTDVHVQLPAIRVSAIVAMAAAIIVLYGAYAGHAARFALIGIGSYVLVSVIGRGILPLAVQRLVVIPNELAKETEFLQRHVSATRAAWGLDRVTTRDLSGEAQLSMADIKANAATIGNVRLWERDLVEQSFGQLQEIRTYYDFVSVTDDRYTIDGKYRQVHLAARELNTAKLPTRTFINDRFTFTHGMGVTMAPVNQVTPEGLPLLFIKDLPPVSEISVALKRPQIYYGELTNSYVFAGTKQEEFDYPAGEANVHTAYAGKGGVPFGSLTRRALYAWQFGSAKILLSNDITGAARILYHRNIVDRARTALPFLTFDPEPYLVINDAGELEWILDAYTKSGRYPYAKNVGDVNYLRNSVKVVIDAYDGSVDAYVADSVDAIVRTYEAIFSGVFKPLASMPADLRRHLRYPGELFRMQAGVQSTYHMEKPETFYHREDQWQIPAEERGQAVNPFMRHIMLRLPGEKQPEFIYMTPFTPRGKDNLAAWMVARMDGDKYGQLVVYRFPKQSLVYGPKQVANRINQETGISAQLTLWDQKGSDVIRGEMLVIPIEESLIYVQPLFLRASGGTIPELKRVVIVHGNSVIMAETLEEGLAQMFGGANTPRSGTSAAPAPAAPGGNVANLLRQAQDHYDRAISAQRTGDWAAYGREIEALGAVLRLLNAAKR
jgi:hypothetical protein